MKSSTELVNSHFSTATGGILLLHWEGDAAKSNVRNLSSGASGAKELGLVILIIQGAIRSYLSYLVFPNCLIIILIIFLPFEFATSITISAGPMISQPRSPESVCALPRDGATKTAKISEKRDI